MQNRVFELMKVVDAGEKMASANYESDILQKGSQSNRRKIEEMPRGVEGKPMLAKQLGLPSGKVGCGHNKPSAWPQQTVQPFKGAQWICEMLDRVPEGNDIEGFFLKLRRKNIAHDESNFRKAGADQFHHGTDRFDAGPIPAFGIQCP